MEETTDTNIGTSRAEPTTNEPIGEGGATMHKDSSDRLRDEKGHFIPNPNKPCTHGKRVKKTRKQMDDENTVKIHIVKEEPPPPDKDFSGRLEDIKERTATNFIKAVCYHKPRAINIDGLHYYSQDYVKLLRSRIDSERAHAEYENCVCGSEIDYHKKVAKKLKAKCFVWQSIANVSIACLLTLVTILGIKKFCHAGSESHVEDAQKQVIEAGMLK